MKIIIWGAKGRLGKSLFEQAQLHNIEIVAGIDSAQDLTKSILPYEIFSDANNCRTKADVVIDFSSPLCCNDIVNYCLSTSTPVVIATTGHTEEQLNCLNKLSECVAVFKSTNMSIGVNLLRLLTEQVSAKLNDWDVEIVEKHHNHKADSPSGTALTLAKAVNNGRENKLSLQNGRVGANCKRQPNELGMHSLRGGTVIGDHDVIFFGESEVITLSHQAQDKAIFTNGALRAAQFIITKSAGFYDMEDLLK